MTTTKTLVAAAVAAIFALPAAAATLDFENGAGGVAVSGETQALVGNEYAGAFGVTFSTSGMGSLELVQVGGPSVDGFVPNDTPHFSQVGQLGEYFLATNFATVSTLHIDYAAPVIAASFDVADIDGSGDDLEVFTFKAFNGMMEVGSFTRDGDDTTVDGEVLTLGFSGIGAFDRIEIQGATAGGSRLIGIAFDNFNTTTDVTNPIPLPAAAWMMLASLGGLGLLSRKKRA